MTTWRIVTRSLYDLGGTATNAQIRRNLPMCVITAGVALNRAAEFGLVHRTGPKTQSHWHLTTHGWDWCENKIQQVETRPGGRRWVATWLISLPRGVRIHQKAAS